MLPPAGFFLHFTANTIFGFSYAKIEFYTQIFTQTASAVASRCSSHMEAQLHTRPMVVQRVFYHDGSAGCYAQKFHPDGVGIEPGYLYDVEFSVISQFYLTTKVTLVIHEKWLVE
jgi:hypothetical protein